MIVQNDPCWTGDVVRVVFSLCKMSARFMVFFLQWSKEEVEIKTVSLTIVGAEQAKT